MKPLILRAVLLVLGMILVAVGGGVSFLSLIKFFTFAAGVILIVWSLCSAVSYLMMK